MNAWLNCYFHLADLNFELFSCNADADASSYEIALSFSSCPVRAEPTIILFPVLNSLNVCV